MIFCVLRNLIEHARHGKDEIDIIDSTIGKAESYLETTGLLFCRWGGSQFFLFEFLEGHFIEPFYGEGRNFLAKLFLSLVALPHPSK